MLAGRYKELLSVTVTASGHDTYTDVLENCRVTLPERKQPADVRWYYAAMDDGKDSKPSAAVISKYIKGINEQARSGAWSTLNGMLMGFKFDNSSTTTVITICRATYPFRKHPKLSAWEPLLVRARGALIERGQPAEQLLRGLF